MSKLEIDTNPSNISHSSLGQETIEKANTGNDISSQGISMENASYIESNLEINNLENNITSEEYTPKLFSEDKIMNLMKKKFIIIIYLTKILQKKRSLRYQLF